MKIKLDELKKAVAWVEANTNALDVKISIDPSGLSVTVFDRQDREVVIYLYDEGRMMAKIKRTETL